MGKCIHTAIDTFWHEEVKWAIVQRIISGDLS